MTEATAESTTTENVTTVEPTEEEQASSQGWVPQEEWHGPKHEWVPAGEFLRRGSLFRKIEQQKTRYEGELNSMRQALTALQTHHKKVFDSAYNRALRDLQTQKIEAAKEGDAATVVQIDEQIDNMKQSYNQEVQTFVNDTTVKQQTGPAPEYVDWVQKNMWYLNDQELHAYADQIGAVYGQANPNISYDDVLNYVTVQVRKKYPHKFGSKPTAPSVEGAGNRGNQRPNHKYQLDETEQAIMKTLVKSGVMTEEEYIADLRAAKGEK